MSICKITVHCAATPNFKKFTKVDIYNWHTWPCVQKDGSYKYKGKSYESKLKLPIEVQKLVGNGWSDVGYHWVLEVDGTVVEGRPEHVTGAHVAGYNSANLGICMIGTDEYTQEQWDSLEKLLIEKSQQYNVPIKNIRGHCDYDKKKPNCPGFNVEKFVNKIISK